MPKDPQMTAARDRAIPTSNETANKALMRGSGMDKLQGAEDSHFLCPSGIMNFSYLAGWFMAAPRSAAQGDQPHTEAETAAPGLNLD